ncbi:MAG TPA: anhydro-N-acetylmuramic acid kinase, partial [Gammaproteobacteria bacterium]
LQMLCTAPVIDPDLLGQTDARLALLYAETIAILLQNNKLAAGAIAGIGCHGQTIRHRPPQRQTTFSSTTSYTLQIGDPNRLVEMTGITVIADFRRRDMAAGGQGAPLVPAFHAYALHSPKEQGAVLNLGGIANITLLPSTAEKISGFDTGPANILLDTWTQLHFQKPCDHGGELAANGVVDRVLLDTMLQDPYFKIEPPKSTGREYFNLDWIRNYLPASQIDVLDVLATLTHLTAHSIANALRRYAPQTERLLICGGGVHNGFLMKLLTELLTPCAVVSTAEKGLDPDFVEAIAFAWLAKQTLEHKTGNLPVVTGANKAVILGGVYYA